MPLQLDLYTAEISIHEIALGGDPTAAHEASIYRTRHLFGCTQAIKQWFEAFFTIPIADLNGITTSLMLQLRHIMGLFYVLTTIDEPGWKKEDVFEMIDLYTTLDRLAESFSQVPAALSFRGDIEEVNYAEERWTHVANTVRTLRTIWSGQDERGSAAPGASTAAMGADPINLDGIDFDIPGLDWLMDPSLMTYTA